jgi:hypothetical protein
MLFRHSLIASAYHSFVFIAIVRELLETDYLGLWIVSKELVSG